MPNKKINQLDAKTAISTDLMLVGDPTNGTAYKSTLANLPLVPSSRTLTINGVAFDLSANRAWTIDTLPAQAGNSGKYLTTNGTAASWGTIDLSGYVPYTGATGAVNLGAFGITAASLIKSGGTSAQFLKADGSVDSSAYYLASNPNGYTNNVGTVTSVGLTMPSAFNVGSSPITSSGTLAVTALGTASQYIRGDGVLATLPTGGSGGSSVSYYLNGGTAASVGTYFQMSTNAVVGTNADFTRTGNGLISQFLTDVGDPNRLQIPAGNWNFEMFFSMSSSGGNTAFYVELLKYDGTTFTSIASSTLIPEEITGGTNIDLYLTSLAIPATTLLATDRLALRVYIVNNSGGRTATLHTQDSHLCQIITNFAGGVSALNGLTANTQYFATGTSGTDFGISSASDTHTFNLPTASATNRGALSSADWTTFNGKVSGSGVANQLTYWDGTGSITGSAGLVYNDSTGAFALSKSQNNPTAINITNATSGTSGRAGISFISNTASGQFSLQKYSTLHTAYKINLATDAILYNDTAGDISILNDFATGKIKFASGGASTAQMTLTSAGRLLLGTTTEGLYGLDVANYARVNELNVSNGYVTLGGTGAGRLLFTNSKISINFGSGSTISSGANNVSIAGNANSDFSLAIFGSVNTSSSGSVAIGVESYANGVMAVALGQGSSAETLEFVCGNREANERITNVYFGSGKIRAKGSSGSTAGVGVSYTINGSGAFGTDFAGGNITIAGGKGTGTGTSGDVIISTATPTTSGTTLQSLTSRWWVKGSTGTLSNVASPNASAQVQIDSTTQGFLPPRMTTTERNAIASPATGLVVYQTDGTEGLYEKTSSAWRIINGGGGSVDELQVALLSQVYG